MDKLHFYEFNSKKSANFAVCARGARSAMFSFLKITGTLKEILFEYLQIPSFYIKEHSPKRKLKIKFFYTFYFGPPKWAKWFLAGTKEKLIFFSVSIHF